MKRLLFFDIDGTLTMPGCPPSRETADAIRKAREAGHMAFLSTGRALEWVEPAVLEIGFDGGIFHAGGRCLVGGHCISEHRMPEHLLRDATAVLLEEDAFFIWEGETESWRGELRSDFISHVRACGRDNPELLRILQQWTAPQNKELAQRQADTPVYKISFFCTNTEQMARTVSRLQIVGNVVRFDTLSGDIPLFAGEFSACETNKARGMYEICRYLGVKPEDCIAFGDSMNDAEILRAAGLGVAMGNSGEDVKQLADMVCDSCGEDGIAKTLARLNL